MKKCLKCEKEKPYSDFWRQPTYKDGYFRKCKECVNEERRIRNSANREKVNAYHREYYRKRKERFEEIEKA